MVKVTPSPLHHGGKPWEKLSQGKLSSPRRLEMAVAESRHDLLAAPPAPWRLEFDRASGSVCYWSFLGMAQCALSQLGCREVGVD